MLCGYVTGPDTLYEGAKQLQTGEIAELDPRTAGSTPATSRYCRFITTGDLPSDEEELAGALAEVLDGVFGRYAAALGGGRLAVPLSGGRDSRTVVAMLRRHGVRDVLCYSYGLPGNAEAAVSRQVAQAVGYDWEFVEYGRENWARWMASADMERYWRYAMQGCSLPHFQDLPAAAHLLHAGKVVDGVYLPGHSGDFLAGSHIPRELYGRASSPSSRDAVEAIVAHHFQGGASVGWPGAVSRLPRRLRHRLAERLERQVALDQPIASPPDSLLHELWDFENRQAKYIVNSVRAYEFHGQRWALPLWDYELMDFSAAVPENLRWEQRLYADTLADRVFTGSLRKLREIPLAGGRPVGHTPVAPSVTAWATRLRRAVRRAVYRLGLGALWNAAKRLAPPRAPHPLGFDCWFADGQDPLFLTVGRALGRRQVRRRVPPLLWKLLRVDLPRPVAEHACCALLAIVALARAYEDLHGASCSGER